jgi:hypothetical protein
MSINISGGVGGGITIETDPTALKLTGGTLSGELELPQIGNLLNAPLVINSYNDTGAGTNFNHTFTPFDGKFNLAPNGGGLTFPNGTTQVTAGLPLTGGTVTGKVTYPTSTTSFAPINLGVGGVAPTNPVAGDLWFGNMSLQHTDFNGVNHIVATNRINNTFLVPQTIDSPTNATAPALRVTQRGTGNAFVVEDSTSPDSNSFVVNANGNVGIGVNPASFAPAGLLSIDVSQVGGPAFWANGPVIISGPLTFFLAGQTVATHTNNFSVYNREIAVVINGDVRYIPYR